MAPSPLMEVFLLASKSMPKPERSLKTAERISTLFSPMPPEKADYVHTAQLEQKCSEIVANGADKDVYRKLRTAVAAG